MSYKHSDPHFIGKLNTYKIFFCKNVFFEFRRKTENHISKISTFRCTLSRLAKLLNPTEARGVPYPPGSKFWKSILPAAYCYFSKSSLKSHYG